MLCLISSTWHMRLAVGSSCRGRITTGIYAMTRALFMPRSLVILESTALDIRGHVYSSAIVCWLSRDLSLDVKQNVEMQCATPALICTLFYAHHFVGISSVIDCAHASPATPLPFALFWKFYSHCQLLEVNLHIMCSKL
jgi:hypothetical protein